MFPHTLFGQPVFKTDFSHQTKGPQAGGLAKDAGTLVQDGLEAFDALGIQRSVNPLRSGRVPSEDAESLGIERMDDIAHRVFVTAHLTRNLRYLLPRRALAHDLATTQFKGL